MFGLAIYQILPLWSIPCIKWLHRMLKLTSSLFCVDIPIKVSIYHLCSTECCIYFLYRDYARSKLCVSMAVQSGCAIGDLMENDLYNPFCIDGIDPLSLPSTAGLLVNKCSFCFIYIKSWILFYKVGTFLVKWWTLSTLLMHVLIRENPPAFEFYGIDESIEWTYCLEYNTIVLEPVFE